ncbi:MAG: hypothetical protein SAJ37_09000 [Oscillatoria sp. PMC 1068.18]|nr:hypothetical protein [Oscillatoria sp. PMC 1076.18]MEC4988871.1 hypothetical protein [Oscillatoria sp. PMC 1068.18]
MKTNYIHSEKSQEDLAIEDKLSCLTADLVEFENNLPFLEKLFSTEAGKWVEISLLCQGIIEVDKLAVYQKLGIREVWFWENNLLTVYCLRNEEYAQNSRSELLPNLDLALLAEYVVKNDPLDAIVEFRAKISQTVTEISSPRKQE